MTDQQHTTKQLPLALELREPASAPRLAEALELEHEAERTQDRGRWGA